MLGLEKDTVKLVNHQKEWNLEAKKSILLLKKLLGSICKDIQHIGSTAIPLIKAKPIIDLVVAVDDFQAVLAMQNVLKENGFYYRPNITDNQLLFACGNYYDGTGQNQTHFIHFVKVNSIDWNNYLNFRNYLNTHPKVAKQYETLKVTLAQTTNNRQAYTLAKQEFITATLRKALAPSYLNQVVKIVIDRPLGSKHPKYSSLIYPINYGYIKNVLSGDGEELDVYLLGVNEPVKEYQARIIAIIYRQNDTEDKLVAAPEGISYTKGQIEKAVHFQEQYFQSEIEI